MARPNVLFIVADQHSAKCLGHKNHPDVKTPNLDRLAAEGVRFDNAVIQNPICTPSRVSFLSGQYCHNHGYYGLCGPNPSGLPNVLGEFRKAGYTTAAIGKIHCPEYWVEDRWTTTAKPRTAASAAIRSTSSSSASVAAWRHGNVPNSNGARTARVWTASRRNSPTSRAPRATSPPRPSTS
ncbi:MAG: sulfatase-like hydrolase/transferase [Planctomycetes bacterium]|nr:sulfatase-like hydrolase/transferase [Planctomycetota bacterium]